MNQGIIDVVEWQTNVDMRRGTKVDTGGHLVDMAREVLQAHPYPGDLDKESSRWVTNVALDLYNRYQPQFVMLSYAQPFFLSVFQETPYTERKEIIKKIFKEISRFREVTGMVPVILGTGGLVPVAGYIDLGQLDGLALGGGMICRYAGLYDPTDRDLSYVRSHPRISNIFNREELMAHFGKDEEFVKRLPDYLVMAKEGYVFKTFGSIPRPFYRVPAKNDLIPVNSPFGKLDSITDIRKLIEDSLSSQKIALIIIEGIGPEDFLLPDSLCGNTFGWYQYAPGDGQYLALTTGKHLPYHSYLPGFKHYIEDSEDREYPFSGLFAKKNLDTLGSSFAGRSAAVGTRSILTHMASGADITIECFARGLYNYGTIGVINTKS